MSGKDKVGWTPEEIDEMFQSRPVAAEDIETGGWEDFVQVDGQTWVEEQRRKREMERRWRGHSS
jgi:hypothetical protein